MIAKYTEIHLRYKLIYNVSRCLIKDDASNKNIEYPLYWKGVEKSKFDIALSLLRKNILQVRSFSLFLFTIFKYVWCMLH